MLIRRELAIKYRGSYLGIAWSLLHPLAFLAVFTIVFGKIVPVAWPSVGLPASAHVAMELYCGLIVFNFFAETLGTAPRLLLGYQNFIKKTVFPTQILPVTLVATAGFHALVNLALLVAAGFVLGTASTQTLWLPLLFLPGALLCLGLAWLLSAAGIYVRDLAQAMPIGVQLLLFASPVFYPASAVPGILGPLYAANPIALGIEGLRDIVIHNTSPDWKLWSAHLIAGLAVCALGYRVFRDKKHDFADTL